MTLDELLVRLNARRDDLPEPVVRLPLPFAPIAEGFQSTEDIDEILASDLPVHLGEVAPGVGAYAMSTRPRMIAILTDTVEPVDADVRRTAVGWMLDASDARPRSLVLPTEAGPLLVHNDGREVLAWPLDEPPADQPSTLEALAGWRPPQAVECPALPTVADVLGEAACPSWLTKAATDLELAGGLLQRVAALGVIGRLWRPPADGFADWLRQPVQRTPPGRAWAAGRTLSSEAVDAIVADGVAASTLLYDDLRALEDAVSAGDDPTALTRALATVFDDLVSAHALIARSGRAERLARALEAFDRDAATQASLLPHAGALLGDARLEAAAAVDPDAWWAELAR